MLTDEILNENHHLDIPQSTIELEIAALVSDLEKKIGFKKDQPFDPDIHLIFSDEAFLKTEKHTLAELGINKTHCPHITDLAGTQPFPLFSEEAIDIMKWEIFHDPEFLKEFGRVSVFGKDISRLDFQISGFVHKTRFIREAWRHPKTMEIMHKIAGIKLKIPHVFSEGLVNASLVHINDRDKKVDSKKELIELKRQQDNSSSEIPSTLYWHYDSPPFVLVLMLSAPECMVGGETAIKTGNESIFRIPNPKVGYATFLQGRVVKHIATKPLNSCDRISYVVSFIPEDINVPDTTVCTSEKPSAAPTYTNDKFYPNWVNYRFERLEKRMQKFRESVMNNYENNKKFDQMRTIEFCKDIEQYLKGTWKEFEIVNDDVFPPKLFSIPYSNL